ncbi:MAG: TRAP transporter small permease [Rhodospirillales bacterium]|nr:TRAP transporter small permease [Rhodospirillales bacterium]
MNEKFIKLLHRTEEGFLAFLLAGMTIVTFSQVVARYIFNTGAIWALELTTFLFAWLVILGISYGVRIHSHIGVDAFVKLLRPGLQRIFGLLAIMAGVAYGILMLIGGWDQAFGIAFEYDFETEDLKLPMWMPLSIMVFGFATMIIRLLMIAWRIVFYHESAILIADEAGEAIEQFADDDQVGDKGENGS